MRALARHLSDNALCILAPPPPSRCARAPVVGLPLTLSARARLQSQAERLAPLHGRTSALCARARRAWEVRASRSTSRAPPSTASSRSSCARAATSRAATAAPARAQGTPSFPPAQPTAREPPPEAAAAPRAAPRTPEARLARSPSGPRSSGSARGKRRLTLFAARVSVRVRVYVTLTLPRTASRHGRRVDLRRQVRRRELLAQAHGPGRALDGQRRPGHQRVAVLPVRPLEFRGSV